VGVNYNYRGITGHELGLSLGQREWEKQPSDFSLASGLAGAKSDLFLTAQVETPFGLNFYASTHLDDQRKTGKSEVISKFNFKNTLLTGDIRFYLLMVRNNVTMTLRNGPYVNRLRWVKIGKFQTV